MQLMTHAIIINAQFEGNKIILYIKLKLYIRAINIINQICTKFKTMNYFIDFFNSFDSYDNIQNEKFFFEKQEKILMAGYTNHETL